MRLRLKPLKMKIVLSGAGPKGPGPPSIPHHKIFTDYEKYMKHVQLTGK